LADDFKLPDSESQRAYDLLADRFPTASGTSAMIVFHPPSGPLEERSTNVRATLDAIAQQPHVVSVSDPFETPGALTPDGSIGYAQVAYDQTAVDLGTDPYDSLLSEVEKARSAGMGAGSGGVYRWR